MENYQEALTLLLNAENILEVRIFSFYLLINYSLQHVLERLLIETLLLLFYIILQACINGEILKELYDWNSLWELEKCAKYLDAVIFNFIQSL